MPQRRQRWLLLAVVLLAFGLRAYSLGRAPIWFDEALSAVISAKTWQGIISYSARTPFEHPPTFYLALHLWMIPAGSSSFALRFFSLFWGVLLIPVLYRFVRSWGGHRWALLTSLVAAVSVSHIEQSQNARMYTAVVFLGVLSLYLFLRALRSGRRLEWAGYLLATGLGIAIHYYFVLLLLVPVVYLAQHGRRYRRLLVVSVGILVGTALLALGWLWLSPGPRQAVLDILRGEGAGVSTLALRARNTLGGLLLDEPTAGAAVFGFLALAGVLLWPVPSRERSALPGAVGSRRFVLTWLLVPWLAALAIPYYLQGRHLAYLWPALFTLAGAGLMALLERRRWLFVGGLLLVAAASAYGLVRSNEEAEHQPDYGQVIAHIESRALPGDLVVMDQPAMWPFLDYYGQGDLQLAYVPGAPMLSQEAVAQQLESSVEGHSRIWFGPTSAWTADPDGYVAAWLDTNAFQAYREWFEGSSSAALYFAPAPLARLSLSQIRWENGIRLLRAYSSPMDVAPGEAVRLKFQWDTDVAVDVAAAVSVDLVDEQGNVWATRSSEPCSGSCPTDSWQPGQTYDDQHALLIPPGTPPGPYRLQLSWYVPAEDNVIPVNRDGSRIDLGSVKVSRAAQPPGIAGAETMVSNPLDVEFGDQLALLGFDAGSAVIPAGKALLLNLSWSVLNAPSGDLVLRLELVDAEDHVVVAWDRPPVAGFFPPQDWQVGDYVRSLKRLEIPVHVLPGSYRLRLKVLAQTGQPLPLSGSRPREAAGGLLHWDATVEGDSLDLTPLEVLEKPDRAHSYEIPAMSHDLDARVGDQAELLGYDLGTGAARPGGQLKLTLYWRARGPLDRSYKVFTHLGDGVNPPLAQDDALPGQGCCPTNTWVDGEIIADEHVILLPEELPAGSYHLTAGLYDEASGQRLPVLDASGSGQDDQVYISTIAVSGPPTPVPVPADTESPYGVYLPLINNDW